MNETVLHAVEETAMPADADPPSERVMRAGDERTPSKDAPAVQYQMAFLRLLMGTTREHQVLSTLL